MSERFSPDERIEDVAEAQAVAKIEKPFRDAGREEGVSPEDKATLDRTAERKGEKAIADINKEKERKNFLAKETVNGVEISVGWDRSYDDYTIYLPQIETGSEEAEEKDVSDQVIRMTRLPDAAKLVFDYACLMAKKEPNPYNLYKKLKEFGKTLPYDEGDR